MERSLRMANRQVTVAAGVAAAVAGVMSCAPSARADQTGSTFDLYGFAQADFIIDLGGRLEPAWDDAFRPSKICLDGACGSDGQSSLSVKQSRLGVKGAMPTGADSAPLHFKFEFDAFGVGEDAGQTSFHLRHAYGEWGSILVGQTDSLFSDGDAGPNTIDYWGPTGLASYRNVQLRWTPFRSGASRFSVAIERPGNDIDPGNLRLIEGFEDLHVQNDEELPDLTVQYHVGGDWGHVQLGGVLRKVGYELSLDGTRWVDGSEAGWGLVIGTGFNTTGQDQLLLQVVGGEGIASYMNDGGMDLAPRVTFDASAALADVSAEAVPLVGVSAYYEHFWNERWSSSIGYSYTEVDNTNFQEQGTFHKGDYASGNLLCHPADNLMFGAEVLWGKRTDNDGSSDDDVRFQFTARYTFGTRLP
jgi:hypothetical protein